MTARLPSYSSAALACLSLAPDCKTAVLVYADQRLVEVEIATARYTAFSQGLASRYRLHYCNRYFTSSDTDAPLPQAAPRLAGPPDGRHGRLSYKVQYQ